VDGRELEQTSNVDPKLGSSLRRLLEAHRGKGLAEAQTFAQRRVMVLDGDRVQVVIVTTEEAVDDLREAIEALGGAYQGHHKTLLQALVPLDTLESLARRPDVRVVREPRRPAPVAPLRVGDQTTEGVAASNVSAWHTAGYDGTGVRIAVIDVGFADYIDLLGTDLPASVTVYDWTGSGMGGSEHGTACAEIAYDVAYGATIDLHKIGTNVELGNAVDQAIADDVDIISMSLSWPIDGPGDGTGYLADIVADARLNGIFFAVAAGNEAEVSWSGGYVDSGTDNYHAWDGNDLWYNFIVITPESGYCYAPPAGTSIWAGLHWDDWIAVNQDYDLHLFRYSPRNARLFRVASSTDPQSGGAGQKPEEFVAYAASGDDCYAIVVERVNASRNVYLSLDVPDMPHLEEWVPERSLGFPADSPDAITVGAIDVSSYDLESYSSRGPAFGPGGSPLGGATKPDIVAYANVSTVSYGPGVFNGTSSATPHVAGMAALVKQRYPGYSVTQVQNYLEDEAVDLGTPGKDDTYGAGRLYLEAPGLAAPSELSATPLSQTRIDLSWTDNGDGEEGFQIERSSDGTSGWVQIGAVGANVTTYADTDLSCGTPHHYRVRAYNSETHSAFSNLADATTDACAVSVIVTSITPDEGANTGIVHITDLAGDNFQSGATVHLATSGQPDITATNVTVVSASQITCHLDLTGAAPGQRDVVVTNPGDESGQLSSGFTVRGLTYLPTAWNRTVPSSSPAMDSAHVPQASIGPGQEHWFSDGIAH
jgi:hypothetical protein